MDERQRAAQREFDATPSPENAQRLEAEYCRGRGPPPALSARSSSSESGLYGKFWGDMDDWLLQTSSVVRTDYEPGIGDEDDLRLLIYKTPHGIAYMVVRCPPEAQIDQESDPPERSQEVVQRLLDDGARAWTIPGLGAACLAAGHGEMTTGALLARH